MFHKKLPPHLNTNLAQHGYDEPFPFQREFLSRAVSGSDFIFGGKIESGKSTAILMYCIWKLKEAVEDAPRAIVMVSGKEEALQMLENFTRLSYSTGLRATVAYEGGPLDIQRENIYVGVDLVIGTPRRIQEIYFQNGINVNKLRYFILDDGENLIRKGYQGYLHRFWQSLPKCQNLVLSADVTDRLVNLAEEFMKSPEIIEVE